MSTIFSLMFNVYISYYHWCNLDELLERGDEDPVCLVKVEDGNVSALVGVEVGLRSTGRLLGLHRLIRFI